jgi:hypothetical protein
MQSLRGIPFWKPSGAYPDKEGARYETVSLYRVQCGHLYGRKREVIQSHQAGDCRVWASTPTLQNKRK